ncbi:MAG: hypothetical protein ACP5HK_03225 [Acidilobus sp.]
MRSGSLPARVRVSAPVIVYIGGRDDLDLLIALREPKVHVDYPPQPGQRVDEVLTLCGPVRFSYRLSKPELLTYIRGLEVYANIIARSAFSLAALRLCIGGLTSISEAVQASKDIGSEALAYALSLGGAVLSRRSASGGWLFIGRWQLPGDTKVVISYGAHQQETVNVIEVLSRILNRMADNGDVCSCSEARLGLNIKVSLRESYESALLVTRFDNRGAEIEVHQD